MELSPVAPIEEPQIAMRFRNGTSNILSLSKGSPIDSKVDVSLP
jgi:hypothetical protein